MLANDGDQHHGGEGRAHELDDDVARQSPPREVAADSEGRGSPGSGGAETAPMNKITAPTMSPGAAICAP